FLRQWLRTAHIPDTNPATMRQRRTMRCHAPPFCASHPTMHIASTSTAPRTVVEVLQHAVGHRHHPRTCLVAALNHDHVGKLLGEVDVRHLQAPTRDLSEHPL